MNKEEIIELMQPFCSKDRIGLTKPFSKNGHTYATDGRVMVCFEKIKIFEDESKVPVETVLNSKNAKIAKAALVSLPNLPECDKSTCNECGGSGKVEWNYKLIYKKFLWCPQCRGEGVFKKTNKAGKLVRNLKMPVLLDCRWYSWNYLNLIKTLSELKIVTEYSDLLKPLLFSWKYGYGALMPLNMNGDEVKYNQLPLLKEVA